MRLRASALALALAVSSVLAQTPAPKATPPAPGKREQIKLQALRGPIKITAERADLDRSEYALYRGHVRLTSAELDLSGDRLELRQPVKGQFTARLTGGPAYLHHAAVADAPAIAASAAQVDYDTRTAQVQMSGGAEIQRGTDHIASDTIKYNVLTRRISASGTGKGQVQMTVQPPQQQEDKLKDKAAPVPQNTAPFAPRNPTRPPR